MNIGISWNAYKEAPMTTAEQIELLKKNGFTNTFADAKDPGLRELVPELRKNGIECDTLHAPFNGINHIWADDDSGEDILGRLIATAELCAELDIPVMVVHLSSGDNAPRITDSGYERFKRLVDTADALGVKVAFENQRKLANLAFAMEVFPSAGFCWDAGHEKCFAYGRRYMPLFGSRLCALHIHDNDCEHGHDLHKLPYSSKIDFETVAREIADSGYDGTVMLEVFSGVSGDYKDYTAEEFYAEAGSAAARLRDRIVSLRG